MIKKAFSDLKNYKTLFQHGLCPSRENLKKFFYKVKGRFFRNGRKGHELTFVQLMNADEIMETRINFISHHFPIECFEIANRFRRRNN